jgi:hypothetical protein
MKKLLLLVILLGVMITILPAAQKKNIQRKLLPAGATMAWRDYPLVSIHDLQYVSYDSLRYCDSIVATSGPASTTSGPWTKQTSAYYKVHNGGINDTVEIVGQIIVPPKYISFTGIGGYNLILRDTASGPDAWSSILIRTSTASDTAALYNASLLTYESGDIIRLRGYVDEYPTGNFVSGTQFVPVASTFLPDLAMASCVEYVDTKDLPSPPSVTVDQFMNGSYESSGKNIKYSTGEQWESVYIELSKLTVVSIINSTNGTFSMQDAGGNEIGMMDGTRWFTLRSGAPSGSPLSYRDPSSTYATPSTGQFITTIRGYIFGNSGSDASRGYRIFPVFKGDIVYGSVYPAINTQRRTPVAVTPSDSVNISVKAYSQGAAALKAVYVHYKVGSAAWDSLSLTGPNESDSTWAGKLRPVGADTLVKYFCTVIDDSGKVSLYASAASGSSGSDTSQGFFFYTVRDRPLTISDIQYTPFANGWSGLIGAAVTVSGTVTADSSDFDVNNTTGTTPWYIQSGNSPWSGIWVAGSTASLYNLKKGDSVSVYGVVQEILEGTAGSIGRVTRIYDSTVTVLSSGNSIPSPVLRTTGNLAASNGSSTSEPYEGMLVRVENVTVTSVDTTYSEFSVTDNSGNVVVMPATGGTKYSPKVSDAANGKTVVSVGDKFSSIQGILYFSYNVYDIVPRNDDDYGVRTAATAVETVTSGIPKKFALAQNYPNPFNPSTKIDFDLPVSGKVSLKIYNLLGQEVASLMNGERMAGHYTLQFDAQRLSTGVYFYRLQSVSGVSVKKMLLLK